MVNVPIEPLSPSEIFKDVLGYEGLYSVSNMGRVYSHKSNRLLKPKRRRNDTRQLGLCKNKKSKTTSIVRLVAEAFVKNPKPQMYKMAFCKDGNADNLTADNITWGTMAQNKLNSQLNGHLHISSLSVGFGGLKEPVSSPKRERSKVRITRQTLTKVFELRGDGYSSQNIGTMLNRSRKYVSDILNGYYEVVPD